jgi:hypothetical protein
VLQRRERRAMRTLAFAILADCRIMRFDPRSLRLGRGLLESAR